jgi:hypothetical protein
LRDTKPQRRRNRLVTVLLLPVLAVVWLVGWSLAWAGSRKDEEQPRSRVERRGDHVSLIPANAVEQETENERVEVAS